MNVEDVEFKAKIVQSILSNDAGKALDSLGEYYDISAPKLKVGLPKGHISVAGCYVPMKRTIFTKNSEGLSNPFLILHEFYHHLRSVDGKHKGNEKLADKFARDYLNAYKSFFGIYQP